MNKFLNRLAWKISVARRPFLVVLLWELRVAVVVCPLSLCIPGDPRLGRVPGYLLFCTLCYGHFVIWSSVEYREARAQQNIVMDDEGWISLAPGEED